MREYKAEMDITKTNKYKKKINISITTKTKTNKCTGRLRYITNTWRTLLRLVNTKKLNCKVSKNKHTTDENKNNQIHSQINIHKEHLKNIKNINKIEKYKYLNMTERKTDMNITKTDKYKNLNNDSIMEHKTKMNITKIGKYKNLNLM